MATVLLVDDSGTKNGVPSKTVGVNVIVGVVVLALIVEVCYIRSARGGTVHEAIRRWDSELRHCEGGGLRYQARRMKNYFELMQGYIFGLAGRTSLAVKVLCCCEQCQTSTRRDRAQAANRTEPNNRLYLPMYFLENIGAR
jgi:hypothetical protein